MDPGRAGQNSLATAGTNFTKPGAHIKGDLIGILVRVDGEILLQGVRKSPVILTPHFFLAWLEISSSYLVC